MNCLLAVLVTPYAPAKLIALYGRLVKRGASHAQLARSLHLKKVCCILVLATLVTFQKNMLPIIECSNLAKKAGSKRI